MLNEGKKYSMTYNYALLKKLKHTGLPFWADYSTRYSPGIRNPNNDKLSLFKFTYQGTFVQLVGTTIDWSLPGDNIDLNTWINWYKSIELPEKTKYILSCKLYDILY